MTQIQESSLSPTYYNVTKSHSFIKLSTDTKSIMESNPETIIKENKGDVYGKKSV